MNHVIAIIADNEDGGVFYRCSCGKEFSFVPVAMNHARRENRKVLLSGEQGAAPESKENTR